MNTESTHTKARDAIAFVVLTLSFLLFFSAYSRAQEPQECIDDGTCSYVPYNSKVVIQPSAFPNAQCATVKNECKGVGSPDLMVPYGSEDEWSGPNGFFNADIVTGNNPNVPQCAFVTPCAEMSVSLVPSPPSTAPGGTVTLTWTITNNIGAITCTPSSSDGSWPIAGHPSPNPIISTNGNDNVSPAGAGGSLVTYTLTCTDSKHNKGQGSTTVSITGGGGGSGNTCVGYYVHSHAYHIGQACYGQGDFVQGQQYTLTAPYGVESWPYGWQEMVNDIANADTLYGVNPATDISLTQIISSIECGIVAQNQNYFINAAAYLGVCQQPPNYISSIATQQLAFGSVNPNLGMATVQGSYQNVNWSVGYTGWDSGQMSLFLIIDQTANPSCVAAKCTAGNSAYRSFTGGVCPPSVGNNTLGCLLKTGHCVNSQGGILCANAVMDCEGVQWENTCQIIYLPE